MDEKYLPTDQNGCLTRISEECAEIIQAVSKAQRFGIYNHHPETKESNLMAIMREYADLKHAIRELGKHL